MTKIPGQANEFQHGGFLDVGVHALIRLILGNSSLHRRHYTSIGFDSFDGCSKGQVAQVLPEVRDLLFYDLLVQSSALGND